MTQEQFIARLGESCLASARHGGNSVRNGEATGSRRPPGRRAARGVDSGRECSSVRAFRRGRCDKDGSLTRPELTDTFAQWFAQWDVDKPRVERRAAPRGPQRDSARSEPSAGRAAVRADAVANAVRAGADSAARPRKWRRAAIRSSPRMMRASHSFQSCSPCRRCVRATAIRYSTKYTHNLLRIAVNTWIVSSASPGRVHQRKGPAALLDEAPLYLGNVRTKCRNSAGWSIQAATLHQKFLVDSFSFPV